MGQYSNEFTSYNTMKIYASSLSSNDFLFVEIEEIPYLIQVCNVTEKCIRIKFIDIVPKKFTMNNDQVWMRKDRFFPIIEVLKKEHIRDIKIESIT